MRLKWNNSQIIEWNYIFSNSHQILLNAFLTSLLSKWTMNKVFNRIYFIIFYIDRAISTQTKKMQKKVNKIWVLERKQTDIYID